MVDMDKMDAALAAMISEKSAEFAGLSAEVNKTNEEIQAKIKAVQSITPNEDILMRIRANSQKIASLSAANI